MEIYIVEDDMSVISVLQDIIEDNDLGIVCGTSEGQPAACGRLKEAHHG